MIKLDILSDPICPWCYIGKSYLDRALANHPDHPFTIEWHPFQLNPDMPAGGMDRREYLETKFNGKENAVKVYSQIAEAAEAAGLMINFAGIERTPNTLNAHRLIHWAGIEGRQTPVVSFLFESYFEKGQDIGSTDVLVEIAERAEMDGDMIRRLIAGDADADMIRQRDAHARERGVTGVPTFILANQHVLVGAQQPEVWEQVVAELAEQKPTEEPLH
ncbi:DsbA family oxidoreductase [Actibacterium lipolyticum]|uniref:DSBA-like thioredoxin domain protein n=1 Tax=Actibacterium lipolyticum TaxID=1524263 RepID=A0A238JWP3_9RHOB|nr:DsbA family oxidoreductase [Actibacterium lipolyticum]SMX35070.1 DSBA-like thioredoxin domain protein [Actibacterium lipolyticum]